MVKKLREYIQDEYLITEYTKDGETVSHRTKESYLTEEERLEQEQKAKEERERLEQEQRAKEESIKSVPGLQEQNERLKEELAAAQAINRTNMMGIIELANRLRELEEKQ